MNTLLSKRQRSFLAGGTLAILGSQIANCAGSSDDPDTKSRRVGGSVDVSIGGTSAGPSGGTTTGGAIVVPTGTSSSGGTSTGGASNTDNAVTATGGVPIGVGGGSLSGIGGASVNTALGGTSSKGTLVGGGGTTGTHTTSSGGSSGSTVGSGQYVVSMVQSSKANASEITQADVNSLVTEAIEQAGGLGFIKDGQTVVLKPNLLTPYANCWSSGTALPTTVNGVTTDWRVTKAVADLVRDQNPSGKILVMEGSNRNTTTAYTLLGYTSANFGTSVDEFIALEGTGCSSRSTTGLVQKPGASGKLYWIHQRYFDANVVISIGAMKTHGSAGTTGCVKNVGIGVTPNSQYSVSTNDSDCTRNMSRSSDASYIDHSLAGLGTFVSDYYSVRPVDFAVMDALQGLQHGPCSSTASDRMNMRLILAARNAVALDAIQALVMSCDPQKVPYLTKLESLGLGTTNSSQIQLVGSIQGSTSPLAIVDVKKAFAGGATGVCGT